MDPITLIVTALAAGAASAVQDEAKGAVKVAVARLRALARKRLAGRSSGEFVLTQHEQAPDIYEKPLEHELRESGAAADQGLLDAAQELMLLLDARGAQAGKYVINATNVQGAQFGDHNTQTNHFGPIQNINAGHNAYVSADDININR
ncbi:MAG TPA: hypothetical protein VH478_05460 [Trebonia sp.]|nr:hypothetical protein [Trebonia sp.]